MTHSLQRFAPGQRAYCQGKPISISKARRSGRHFILWLEGVQNRDEAEKLRGLMLEIPGKEVPSLPEGRYYHFQILEMEVWTTQGELLGNVKSIIQTGSNDVYVVMGKGREVLIPAVAGLIKSIDPEENRMVVEPWKGLL